MLRKTAVNLIFTPLCAFQWMEHHLHFQKHQKRSRSGSQPLEVMGTCTCVFIRSRTLDLTCVCVCRGLCSFLARCEGGRTDGRGGRGISKRTAGSVEGAARESVWPTATGQRSETLQMYHYCRTDHLSILSDAPPASQMYLWRYRMSVEIKAISQRCGVYCLGNKCFVQIFPNRCQLPWGERWGTPWTSPSVLEDTQLLRRGSNSQTVKNILNKNPSF